MVDCITLSTSVRLVPGAIGSGLHPQHGPRMRRTGQGRMPYLWLRAACTCKLRCQDLQ